MPYGWTLVAVGAVIALVLVTALGVVSLVSLSTVERRRQIGMRRAFGATRRDVLRYFLVEAWLVCGSGLLLGLALAWGLNALLAEVSAAPGLRWPLLVGTAALVWASGLAASLAPALRATRVPPLAAG